MTVCVNVLMPAGGAVTDYFLCIFAGMLVWSIAALALLSRRVAVPWFRCLVRPALVSGVALTLYHVLVGAIGSWYSLAVAMVALIAGIWAFNIVDRQERASLSRHFLSRPS